MATVPIHEDDQGNLWIDWHGKRIKVDKDGSILAEAHGKTIEIDKDGHTAISVDSIRRVSLHDISDVWFHRVTREGEFVFHEMEFVDGGECTIRYSRQGKVVDFTGKKMRMTLTKDNDLILQRRSDDEEEPESART